MEESWEPYGIPSTPCKAIAVAAVVTENTVTGYVSRARKHIWTLPLYPFQKHFLIER